MDVDHILFLRFVVIPKCSIAVGWAGLSLEEAVLLGLHLCPIDVLIHSTCVPHSPTKSFVKLCDSVLFLPNTKKQLSTSQKSNLKNPPQRTTDPASFTTSTGLPQTTSKPNDQRRVQLSIDECVSFASSARRTQWD